MESKLYKRLKTNDEINDNKFEIKNINIIYDLKKIEYEIKPVNYIQKITVINGVGQISLIKNGIQDDGLLDNMDITLCIAPNTKIVLSKYTQDSKFILLPGKEAISTQMIVKGGINE